mgnify:FL=1|jgi:heptaprenyl diphosphate synthase
MKEYSRTKQVAMMGMLVGVALVLSYIEAMIPIPMGIPGAKIGLANLAIVVALYLFGEKKAFGIAIIRLLLVAFTFGNVAAFLYSLGGMLLSFFTMAILRKTGKFSIVSVSCMGGVMHNMGQLVMAFFILQTQVLWTYLPVLILTGVISGVVIGILGGILMERLKGIWRIS